MDWTTLLPRFLAQEDLPTLPELYLTSAIPIILGFSIFIFFLRAEMAGASAKLKYLGAIPLLIGAYLGFHYFRLAIDPVYNTLYMESNARRIKIFHYLAFWIQIAGLIGVFAWGFWHDRSRREDLY